MPRIIRASGRNVPVARHKIKVWAILLCLVLVIAAGLAVYACQARQVPDSTGPLSHRDKQKINQTTDPAPVIGPAAGTAIDGGYQGRSPAEILEELKKQQVVVTDTLSAQANFISGKKGTAGTWLVENAAKNNVIQQAELYLDGLCIARTVSLQPGQHTEEISLIEDVPSGTQKAIAYVNYYSRETQAYISRAGFNIKITVGG